MTDSNPAKAGLPDRLTISVGNPAGISAAAPSGSYTVLDGGASIGSGVFVGATQVSTVTTTFSIGATHLLTVTYSGDATHAAGQTTLSLGVQASSTTTTLQVIPNPVAFATGIQITTTITPVLDASAPAFSDANAGTVTISGLPGGVLSLPIRFPQGVSASTPTTVTQMLSTPLAPGSYILTASFSGSNDLQPSSSASVMEAVAPPSSTTLLSVTPAPGYQAHTITLAARVTGLLATPTGTVQLLDGTTVLATAPLAAGKAMFATIALSTGTHSLLAVYAGDTSNGGSQSAPFSEMILPYDFTVSSQAAAASLVPGGTATAQLAVTSVGSFAEGVTFAFGSLPTGVTATIAPANVVLNAGGTATATITFSSAPVVGALAAPPSCSLPAVLTGILLPALLYLRRRIALPGLLTVLVCCVSLTTLIGCGSKTAGTSVTTQSVQITATSTQTAQVHAASLPLSVTR